MFLGDSYTAAAAEWRTFCLAKLPPPAAEVLGSPAGLAVVTIAIGALVVALSAKMYLDMLLRRKCKESIASTAGYGSSGRSWEGWEKESEELFSLGICNRVFGMKFPSR